MEKNKSASRSTCPACQGLIDLKNRYKLNQLIRCPRCEEILEIIQESPLTLDYADDPYISIRERFPHEF